METLFTPETKTYICHYKHPNGKIYNQKITRTLRLDKIKRWANENPEEYNEFIDNKDKYFSIQDKAFQLQNLCKLSLTCCRNYITKNNL